MADTPNTSRSMQQKIRNGLKGLLRPAVAFAARQSFRIQDLTELLKEVALEVAETDIIRKGQEPNVSRLSAATGLHRRDVTRLWRDEAPPKEGLDVISRILGQWQADPHFTAKNGKPRPLTLEGKKGSFADLVHSISSDLNPYTVLNELERSGAVERRDSGIRLVRRSYQPRGDLEQGMRLLGNDAMTLVDSVGENILNPEKLENLHVRTEYDHIAIDDEEEIRRWFLAHGSELHASVREYLSHRDCDINPKADPGSGRMRVSFVTFSFTEPYEAEFATAPVNTELPKVPRKQTKKPTR